MSIIISGQELFEAIAASHRPVKVITPGFPARRVPPDSALLIARKGDFIGKVSPKGRLFYIREIDSRSVQDNPHHWDERAVMRWYKGVDKETTGLWDRILNNNRKGERLCQ